MTPSGIESATFRLVTRCLNSTAPPPYPPSLRSFWNPLDLHRHRTTYGREKKYLKSSPITSYSEERATIRPRQFYNFRSQGNLQSLIFISGIVSSVSLLVADSFWLEERMCVCVRAVRFKVSIVSDHKTMLNQGHKLGGGSARWQCGVTEPVVMRFVPVSTAQVSAAAGRST